MKIFREFLDAYRERTEVMRLGVSFGRLGGDVASVSASGSSGSEVEDADEPTPWADWLESFGGELPPDDLGEVMWARSTFMGQEPDGDFVEARAVMTSHAVPPSVWKAPA